MEETTLVSHHVIWTDPQVTSSLPAMAAMSLFHRTCVSHAFASPKFPREDLSKQDSGVHLSSSAEMRFSHNKLILRETEASATGPELAQMQGVDQQVHMSDHMGQIQADQWEAGLP